MTFDELAEGMRISSPRSGNAECYVDKIYKTRNPDTGAEVTLAVIYNLKTKKWSNTEDPKYYRKVTTEQTLRLENEALRAEVERLMRCRSIQ